MPNHTLLSDVPGIIRVLVAIEVRLYREGLCGLLATEAGMLVVGTATDVSSAADKAHESSPDVILLNAGFPNSLGAVRALLAVAPRVRIVALALTETDPEVISFAEAGMSGYVTRDGSFEQLVRTIRSVANGEFLCSPCVAAALLRRVARTAVTVPGRLEPVTLREREVMDLIGQGSSNKEIANQLNISVSTVKNHVHHILEKLHLGRRGQVAAVRNTISFHPVPTIAPLAAISTQI